MNSLPCVPEDTKVLTPIDCIIVTKNMTYIQVASICIQASHKHMFSIIRQASNKMLKACELRIGDLLAVNISLLSSGNKVVASNGKYYKIKNIIKSSRIKGY